MNLSPLMTDNVSELLVTIVDFTKTRRRILTDNILNIQRPGFVPKDLAVDEFCRSLNAAIIEHIQNQRLVLRDTDNIKFGVRASLEAKPVVDKHANELLDEDEDNYLQLQIRKLLENLLNWRIAEQLLKESQQTTPTETERDTNPVMHRQNKNRVFRMCSDDSQR
jgi:flagellar basal body rod protein FlgB